MLITGGCHCGAIDFELAWSPDPAEIPARACTCTFCTRHGGVWTATPSGVLALRASRAAVSAYSFGTGTATFHVCARCGVVPAATSAIDGRLYAVVNTNTFAAAARALVRISPVSFDDEPAAVRLARRARNWIATVTLAD